MNETALIQLFNRGHEKALKKIFDMFSWKMFCVAHDITRDKLVSEDIVAECFVKAWERREQFEKIGNVKAFIYITVRNQAINAKKTWVRREKANQTLSYNGEQQDVERQLINKEQVAELYKLINQLVDGQRQVLKMYYFDELSIPEIAKILGLSIDTVRVQKFRGLANLKKHTK